MVREVGAERSGDGDGARVRGCDDASAQGGPPDSLDEGLSITLVSEWYRRSIIRVLDRYQSESALDTG